MELAAQIKRLALDAGFDLAGIAPLAAWRDLAFSQRWVDRGYGGQMHYLRNPKRADPRLILPSAKSVICVGLVYNADLPYSTEVAETRKSKLAGEIRKSKVETRAQASEIHPSPDIAEPRKSKIETGVMDNRVSNFDFRLSASRGWISRYAWGRDYHELTRARLERLRASIEELAPDVETRCYVDTGPIVERAFARLSGIGWVGKNTCLINQEKGSWFFLGVILTSLDLEPDAPAFDRCGSCTRCLDACPTGALVEPYIMDASRCIAYFNIELKGPIPAEFRPAIGANLFGCDICQDVCPWNRESGLENRNPKSEIRAPRRVATTAVSEFHPLTIESATETLQNREEKQTTSKIENRNSKFENRTPRERVSNFDLRFSPSEDEEQRTADPPLERVANFDLRFSDVDFRSSNFEFRFSLFNPRLEDLASLSEEDFRRVFSASPIKRVKYLGWLRNLCVVIGNSGDARLAPWLEKLRFHADPIVREHAEWALGRLRAEDSPAPR